MKNIEVVIYLFFFITIQLIYQSQNPLYDFGTKIFGYTCFTLCRFQNIYILISNRSFLCFINIFLPMLKNALIQNQLQRTLVITIKNEVIHASKIILVLIIDTQANYLIPDYSFPDYLIT